MKSAKTRGSDSYSEWVRPFIDSDDMVVVTDLQGRVIFANRAAERRTGYSLEEMVGNKPGDLWGENMDSGVYKDMWNTLSKGRMFSFTVRNEMKDGTPFYADLRIHPVKNDKGDVIAYMATEPDVTERQKAEDELSAIIHRAKSPASAEKILLDLLRRNMNNFSQEQRDLIADLSHTNAYTLDLLKDLLLASRLRSLSSVSQSTALLSRVVDDVLEKYASDMIRKNLHVTRAYAATHAVPRATAEIIDNVVSNAVKYSTAGSEIKISIAKKHKTVVFSCTNVGIGIPKKDRDMIFTPLFRGSNAAKNQGESSGLGLYIAKRLADDLGFALSFRSGKRNTTFILKMPAA